MSDLVGPFPDGADPDAYDRLRRRVLWSLPTGLFVVGSSGEVDGSRRYNLMTANLVMQVATAPKLVAAAVETEAVTARLIRTGGCFAVSVLARADRAVVRRFVKPVVELALDDAGLPSTMAGEPVEVVGTGSPVLARSVSWVDCRLHSAHELGSHVLFVGEVLDVGTRAGDDEESEVLRMEDTRMNYGG